MTLGIPPGVQFADPDGQGCFSVAVEFLDGTVFGPLDGVSTLDLFTRFDFDGKHFRNDEYFSNDYFFVEDGRLRGRTRVAQRLAERLNALRRRAASGGNPNSDVSA